MSPSILAIQARVHSVHNKRRRYAKVLKVYAKVLCYSYIK